MKILIAASIFPPDIGGPAIYTLELAREFARRSHQVKVVSYGGWRKRLPKGIKHLIYFLEILFSAASFDVLYAQNATSAGLPAIVVAKFLRKRMVLKIVGDAAWERARELHITEDSIEDFQKGKNNFRIELLRALQKFVARNADSVIVPSFYLRDIVKLWGGKEEKIEVIHNSAPIGTNTDFLRLEKTKARKMLNIRGDVILSVGRLVPWKGFTELIEGMPELISMNPNFRLIIVGNGPLYNDLKRMVHDLGLTHVITFVGAVEHKKLPLYFKAADIFVLNSSYEGLSHVILEAMAYGVPVIANNVGGNPELIENGVNGFLAEENSPRDLVGKIVKLHGNQNLKSTFIASSKEKLEEFRFGTMIEETIKVFTRTRSSKKKVLFIGVTAYDFCSQDPRLRKKFEGLSNKLDIFVIARGRPFYTYIWNSKFYLLPRAIYLPAALVIGGYVCIRRNIDAIICQGPLTEGLIGVILKFLFQTELIVEVHGDWREGPFINKKRIFGSVLRKIAPMVGGLSLSCADKIRTLTHITRRETQSHFPRKPYFVFPTFTDIDIFLEEKDASFQKYICTAAVLSPIKNIETLIEAFVKIHNKFPEFKLVIIGDGPSKEKLQVTSCKLQVTSCKLQVTDSIAFTGKLSLEGVKNTMKDCYMFVLPSLSEGFGRVFIEAMALGKPVIGSNVGGVPEIIRDGENGFLVEPKDFQALALKIEELITNPKLTRKMGETGRKFVQENFSNEKYIKNYINMLNS